jgi:hypothetical protein
MLYSYNRDKGDHLIKPITLLTVVFALLLVSQAEAKETYRANVSGDQNALIRFDVVKRQGKKYAINLKIRRLNVNCGSRRAEIGLTVHGKTRIIKGRFNKSLRKGEERLDYSGNLRRPRARGSLAFDGQASDGTRSYGCVSGERKWRGKR